MKEKLLGGILIIYILLVTGCKETDPTFISEGKIEYDVTVIDQTSSMANMIPNKMTVKFKNDKSSATMSAGMGLFSSSFISDPETKTQIICLKLLNKKMVSVQNEYDILKEINDFPCEFIMTKETKFIAGYKCMKVHVKPKEAEVKDFDIYYTKGLNLKNPNFATIFHKIDGVLMEYQIKKMGFELRFTANSVTSEQVDDEVFMYTSAYKKISTSEMNEIFNGLQ